MTLVLKSNTKVKLGKLSDTGLSGVTSHIDFRDKSYILNNVIQNDYLSMLELVRLGRAGKYDVYGEWEEIPDQTGRISVDQSSYNKGFLIEGAFTNLLLNSKAPVSQTITINPSSLSGSYLLSVAGSGSATLTVDGKLIGSATQLNPVLYKPSATGSKSVSVKVIGSLDYFGFYSTVQAVEKVSRITTLGVTANFNADVLRYKRELLTQLFMNFEGCIVVKQFMPKEVFDRKINVVQAGTILQFITSGGSGIFAARQENGASANYMRVKTESSEQFSVANGQLSQSNIYALNFSKGSAKLTVNGSISNEITFSTLELFDLLIGGGTQWSTTVQQYIQEIMTFNRKLSDTELLAITSI